LYDESFEPLWKYIEWRCGGNQGLAEDVVQETWMVAVRRICDFTPQKASFITWLCGIAAKNLQASLRRERSQRPRASVDNEFESRPSEQKAINQEVSLRIATALADLPERFEAVLRAKYLESMAVGEIATSWGETPKAIESLLTRAREAFRKTYLAVDHANDDQQRGRTDSGPAIQAFV
jgi:RNA polymerase sigma-70 factor, ECF subfamily